MSHRNKLQESTTVVYLSIKKPIFRATPGPFLWQSNFINHTFHLNKCFNPTKILQHFITLCKLNMISLTKIYGMQYCFFVCWKPLFGWIQWKVLCFQKYILYEWEGVTLSQKQFHGRLNIIFLWHTWSSDYLNWFLVSQI